MGQLALYMLALRANCEFVGGHKGNRLVSKLKRFLEDEKRAIGHDHMGKPHTSYYQYGLSLLALCLHQKRVHDSVVGKLLYAMEPNHHLHQGHQSVGEWARPHEARWGLLQFTSPAEGHCPMAPCSPVPGTPPY
ncbi:transcobalamin 2 [Phyllostomus discolor]|uniref:Transcobalamin-2 n=1 Tax=Phyllostomus discolor TaxID=89673 RepID=A0A834DMG6_9CHIR|nr:transcobalamin 2 [Phyllostomus discolor]